MFSLNTHVRLLRFALVLVEHMQTYFSDLLNIQQQQKIEQREKSLVKSTRYT